MEGLKELILQNLLYNPQKPLLFTQGFFWVLFMVMMLGYSFFYKRIGLRNAYLFFFSLYFYYKCGGGYVWILIFSIVVTYLIGIGIYLSKRNWVRRFYVALSVLISILLLSYFKYTYFFTDIWNRLFHTNYKVYDYLAFWTNRQLGTHFDISNIFLPIGISFFTFQALSYTVDLYRRKARPVLNIIDFGFYKSFFPQLVAGPIVRAAEFIPQMYAKYTLTNREMGHALFLILNGLLKKMVISDYISINFVDRVFDNPLGYSGFENLMSVYGYSLQIYCDFSGYTDIAIGIALLLGFRIPINFNSPYKAVDLTDFWRRWHISLSSWLRDYLYIPLGGSRKGKVRTYFNLFITMLIGGLWHGANLRFIIWGGLHGLGLIFDKLRKTFLSHQHPRYGYHNVLTQFITFQFVSFAWIFFRATDMQTAGAMLKQIFGHFEMQMVPAMVASYANIFLIILLGYVIHWIPYRLKEKYRGLFITTPIYVKAIVTVLVVIFIFQVKSSVLQPFIYFQF
ncbi:MAG TPA: MBOAT family O-acyltransferase [Bacteroidales bacterium]